jgi:predicted MPP superfamily phosphohydrolase
MKTAAVALWLCLTAWTTVSIANSAAAFAGIFDWCPFVDLFRAAGLLWAFTEPFLIVAIAIHRSSGVVNQRRRGFLKCAAAVTAAAPVSSAVYGFAIAKRDAQVREVTIPIHDLPRDLEGLRLVQITDIHLSPFYGRSQLCRVVSQANELRAHVALVTGDLITSYGDPLDDAILELSKLESDAGIYGCMGNHEIVAEAEDYVASRGARFGMRFLRQDQAALRFGAAGLNLAGVDYQRMGSRYLEGAEALLRKDQLNMLLSHNPDAFSVAACQGWDLTVSGHTHGGQITLEYLNPALNPARYFTPFTQGHYQLAGKHLYVSRGLGTVGLPIRIGAEPEITLIRLARA